MWKGPGWRSLWLRRPKSRDLKRRGTIIAGPRTGSALLSSLWNWDFIPSTLENNRNVYLCFRNNSSGCLWRQCWRQQRWKLGVSIWLRCSSGMNHRCQVRSALSQEASGLGQLDSISSCHSYMWPGVPIWEHSARMMAYFGTVHAI